MVEDGGKAGPVLRPDFQTAADQVLALGGHEAGEGGVGGADGLVRLERDVAADHVK